jgi:type I restriction-modification system DNA methylase subunit
MPIIKVSKDYNFYKFIRMEGFKSKINEVRDILRKDGITGIDSINHCVAFYILRNLSIELCNKFNIDHKYAFINFNKDGNDGILDSDKLFEKFYKIGTPDCFIGTLINKIKFKPIRQFGIKTSAYLERIFNIFASINIETASIDYDVIGLIYEIHLATGTSGTGMRDLGQYFTHRKVIKFMVELCKPSIIDGRIETILDPSMGTGGFLTMATKYLNEHNDNINWTVNQKNIIGFDIAENVQSLAYINLLLENNEVFENICIQDTLHKDFNTVKNGQIDKVDVILANEPFGLKNIIHANCCERIKELAIRGTKAEPLFLQLMMISLNPKGRCAVIVPDGVLFNDANLHRNTRKYLIEKMNLKKVIALEGDFFMNTGVKSSILYFVNDGTTQEVEFSKIKLINADIIEESIKKVKKDILVAKDYTLFINKYIESVEKKLEGVEYKKLGNICEFLQKSKRQASFGSDNGQYPFFTSSMTEKKCDIADYNSESIIIGTGGNASVKLSNNFSCSADNFIIQSNSELVINKYIYYWLIKNLKVLENQFHGTTIKHLGKQSLENIEIPIPSLEIQQQIVDILDNDYNIIKTNKELIKMYEARKKNIIWSNTIGCNKKQLKAVCQDIKTGKNKPSDNKTGTLYPYYGTGGITGYTDEFIVDGKYLLLARNGSIGNSIYIEGKTYPSDHMFIIKSITENIKYLYYVSKYLINFTNYGVGTTIIGISKTDLEQIEIPIPTPEIQEQIVSQCEQIDCFIANLEKEIQIIQFSNVINNILKSITTATTNTTSTTATNTNQSNNNDDNNIAHTIPNEQPLDITNNSSNPSNSSSNTTKIIKKKNPTTIVKKNTISFQDIMCKE